MTLELLRLVVNKFFENSNADQKYHRISITLVAVQWLVLFQHLCSKKKVE